MWGYYLHTWLCVVMTTNDSGPVIYNPSADTLMATEMRTLKLMETSANIKKRAYVLSASSHPFMQLAVVGVCLRRQ